MGLGLGLGIGVWERPRTVVGNPRYPSEGGWSVKELLSVKTVLETISTFMIS